MLQNIQTEEIGRQRKVSKPFQSVLALSLPPPTKSHPLGTNKQLLPPVIKTTVENTSLLQQVIKTPVYQNLAAFSHTSCTQQPHTQTSNSSMYSASATILFPFPIPEEIASDVIESIIQNFNCKPLLKLLFVKIIFSNSGHTLSKKFN